MRQGRPLYSLISAPKAGSPTTQWCTGVHRPLVIAGKIQLCQIAGQKKPQLERVGAFRVRGPVQARGAVRLPSCYFAAPKNAVKSERCLSGWDASTRSESSSLGSRLQAIAEAEQGWGVQ